MGFAAAIAAALNLARLRQAKTFADKLAVERSLLRETDNRPRPEDGDQAKAVPPDEAHDVAAEDD